MTPVRCVPDPTPDYRSLFLASLACTLLAITGLYRGWLLWRSWKWSQ